MDYHDNGNAFEYTKIPKAFYSKLSGEPFKECIDCGTPLYDTDTGYIIEKAVKKYEGYQAEDVVFEYAICMHCADKMWKQMSESSLRKMSEYYNANANLEGRGQQLLQNEDHKIDDWLSNCVIKDTPIQELTEYQICAFCRGDKIVLSHMPYLISGKAIDEIGELLSPKTKGEIDDFID